MVSGANRPSVASIPRRTLTLRGFAWPRPVSTLDNVLISDLLLCRRLSYRSSSSSLWKIQASLVLLSLVRRFDARHKKAWNRRCCLFHVLRLSHCLLELNRQRQSPRRYEYSTPKPYGKTLFVLHIGKGDAYTHIPRTSTVAKFKTLITVICEISARLGTKRQVNAFYVLTPFPPNYTH